MSEQKRVHLVIKGYVQGIGFRWFVRTTALSLGVSGWVRNLDEGDVEAEVSGQSESIDRFIDKIKNNHPYAKVDKIEISPIKETDLIFSGFEIVD